ncbi:hypothetical protein IFM58399_08726 [Aspergillus lentulus]|uniref:BTB domain-containing protein n=1 Tax=Aspergillus lentulus TaxID=293939 RepID=A0ABQ1AXE9_ASPLE|nr:uncharacterized protein IFM58399_08726 [Aspergillus lentulus]GFF50121.1 hypothetical protein IFM58399_08726 [Aspergillus lentulus]GFF74200.1 hypothetical protein IFM62136_08766 [Aspergillus lentulus]GFF88728.1 hypothetical protein IFM47457_07910 [Aspergillus lentulus]GFF89822.1 hypothetical protein IFM60648_08857 [Aspergillus lentulus]GFG15560.1 hypothetical protein IFM61392_09042 [Aspergillus lentulus]
MDTPRVQVGAPEVAQAPVSTQNTETPDVDMNQTQQSAVNESQADATQQDISLPDAQPASSAPTEPPQPPKKKPGLHFLDYLTSPIVELIVGKDEHETSLTAHQSLLLESPFLAQAVAAFSESGPRRIKLPDENVEAFGCFLQFQYTHDYSASPADPPADQDVVGELDDSGELLLRHARVYTLAEKLGVPALKSLAHSKIHRINSTSHGEIAYARYVYTHTPVDDVTIRKPVASFWATRSHVLRHEAEEEFKKLCLEVPEFCFDVLSLVLDQKEKRAQDRAETESGIKGSGRKRLRSGI